MKGILEYHGFTRLIEVREIQEIYEVHIPPTDKHHLKATDSSASLSYMYKSLTLGMHHYLIFKRSAITEIDGEKIAIFELYEER